MFEGFQTSAKRLTSVGKSEVAVGVSLAHGGVYRQFPDRLEPDADGRGFSSDGRCRPDTRSGSTPSTSSTVLDLRTHSTSPVRVRSEVHTSVLPSLSSIPYDDFG